MEIQNLVTKFGAKVYLVPPRKIKKKNAITYKSLAEYVILIREDLSAKKIAESVEHELWHIILGHLDEYKDLSIADKELEVALNMEQPSPLSPTKAKGKRL